jgi:3',5'-cyclic-AMP phosphodiesterase
MRFIHITDSHIGPDRAHTGYGHNAYDNLAALVTHLNQLPFRPDFVLHTGDVVENAVEPEYWLAKELLSQLNYPVYYVNGNHDEAEALQRVLLGTPHPLRRFDYTFEAGGVQVVVLDTRGVRHPAGLLESEQLARLSALCTAEGPPMIIAMHHPPLPVDSRWIDFGWQLGMMLLENGDDFRATIAPARERLRGVFFGHLHRSYQAYRDGVLYVGATPCFGLLESYPDQFVPAASPLEPLGYNIVTVTPHETIIRQQSLLRPTPDQG